jgi:hypothetical protein
MLKRLFSPCQPYPLRYETTFTNHYLLASGETPEEEARWRFGMAIEIEAMLSSFPHYS